MKKLILLAALTLILIPDLSAQSRERRTASPPPPPPPTTTESAETASRRARTSTQTQTQTPTPTVISIPPPPASSGTQTASSETGVLINGVVWATRNIATYMHSQMGSFSAGEKIFAQSPTDRGFLFQWDGESMPPVSANGKRIWSESQHTPFLGWGNRYTKGEGAAWRTARDPSPEGWRLPTAAEMRTLLDTQKVRNEWVTQNGVTGRRFTDIATGKSIFLPAAGMVDGFNSFTYDKWKTGGYYWTSCSHPTDPHGATALSFTNTQTLVTTHLHPRYNMYSIRPVKK